MTAAGPTRPSAGRSCPSPPALGLQLCPLLPWGAAARLCMQLGHLDGACDKTRQARSLTRKIPAGRDGDALVTQPPTTSLASTFLCLFNMPPTSQEGPPVSWISPALHECRGPCPANREVTCYRSESCAVMSHCGFHNPSLTAVLLGITSCASLPSLPPCQETDCRLCPFCDWIAHYC